MRFRLQADVRLRFRMAAGIVRRKRKNGEKKNYFGL